MAELKEHLVVELLGLADSIVGSRKPPAGVTLLSELINETYWFQFDELDSVTPGFGKRYIEHSANVRRLMFRRYICGERVFVQVAYPDHDEIMDLYRRWAETRDTSAPQKTIPVWEQIKYHFAATLKETIQQYLPDFKFNKQASGDGDVTFDRPILEDISVRLSFSPNQAKNNFFISLGMNEPTFEIPVALFFSNGVGTFSYHGISEFRETLKRTFLFLKGFLPHFENALIRSIELSRQTKA